MADHLSPPDAGQLSPSETDPLTPSGTGPFGSPETRVTDRFRLSLAALVGIGIGALVIAAAILIHTDRASNSVTLPVSTFKWSSFKPNVGGNQGAQEIADYVAPSYRLSNAQQLAVITSISTTQLDQSSDTFTGSGLTVAITSGSTAGGDLSKVGTLSPITGQTVAYDLCGQGGGNCRVGAPNSHALQLLARREALELALYTFKYLPQAHNVAIILPLGLASGANAASVTEAVLFSRKGLASFLDEPLDDTLADNPPTLGQLHTWGKGDEAGVVDELTSQSLYAAKIVNQQDDLTLLQLSSLPAQ